MTLENCWRIAKSLPLQQGDLLRDCNVPIVIPDFRAQEGEQTTHTVRVRIFDLIVVTHSCDFLPRPPSSVLLAPISPASVYREHNADFAKKDTWEEIRKGRREGFHLLPSPETPQEMWTTHLVDFRTLYSLPYEYIAQYAEHLGSWPRLQSPWLEHFSQGFARFYMRVALPEPIPSFK